MLTDQQIEFYIKQLLNQQNQQDQRVASLNATIASLQVTLTGLGIQVSDTGNTVTSINASAFDTYSVAGGIVHKLITTFMQGVTFVKTILVTGIATFTAAPVFSSVTATRPLKVDGAKSLISAKIDLASTANDVTGTLARGNGGLGNTSVVPYAGTISGTTAGGTFSGTITGTANLITGAVTGTCSGTTSADGVSGTSSTNI